MKKIKIAIDSRRSSKNGIGRYTKGLISALNHKLDSEPIEIFEIFYHNAKKQKNIISLNEPINCDWEKSELNEKLLENKVDIFISPYYYNTPYIDVPCMRIIHDAIPFHDDYGDIVKFERCPIPRHNGKNILMKSATEINDKSDNINKINNMYREVICHSDALVTVSHHSASDLSRYIPESLGRWNVIYPYVEKKFSNLGKVKQKLNQLVCVGRYEPRKKQLEIINAVKELRLKHKCNLTLKLIGGEKDNFTKYSDIVHKYADENKLWVTLEENIADDKLIKTYSESLLTIFVSSDEGFGYPAIESLACATPVLAQQGTSVHEICSSAAMYYEPNSALSDSIWNAISFSKIVDKEIQTNNIKNFFSEERYVKEMLKVIYSM